ncbi:CPBP family intramembrane glutamic endopeptidase [Geodermatophilus sp. SYSU D00697]
MTTTPQLSPAPAAPPRTPSPGKEIAVFLGTTAALLAGTTAFAASQDADVRAIDQSPPLVQAVLYGQALIPLLAAVLTRLVTTGSLRRPGWGVRRVPLRVLGRAWLWALVTTLAGGALLWVTGLGGVDTGGLGPMTALGLTLLVLPYVVLALAEDVGWRGLLVTRLAEVARPRTVVLVSGVAWGAFHWPLVLFLGGAPDGLPVTYALLCTTLGTTALGAVLASMQLRWGIWPGVLAHAVANATLYHVLAPLTAEREHTAWFSAETGLFGWLVLVVGAAVWLRASPLVRSATGGTVATSRR